MNLAYTQNLKLIDTISAEMAASKVGEEVMIKAKVVTVFFAKNSTGKPTFLNLVKPFPDNPIAIIIFENELKKLNINAVEYVGKTVIVKGIVKYYKDEEKPYKNKASITIYDKKQLVVFSQ
ncbi:MAG: hypothetical protein IPL21_10060 [Saprospirales bacterium]|nr:hypothetical protein [Saprospirales bacterium]